jgi:pyruvate formate-lyase activating enzyme-like uncharacterized protein
LVEPTKHGSFLVGELTEGCRLCTRGAKLVLFATALCKRKCYYCPISPERKGSDVSYANERPVKADADVLEEAHLMGALGTGITGGDPLLLPERTLRFLGLIRSEVGTDHHVHLYTARARIGVGLLSSLRDEGLDELRFHATGAHRAAMAKAARLGFCTGVEIPAIPGKREQMESVAVMADECGCEFLNLNELEVCGTTAAAFRRRGMRLVGDDSMAVAGSLNTALEVARFCEDNTSLNVHVCPSRLKDGVQLRNRLGRIAERVRKPYESIDEDNLLVKTVLTPRRVVSARALQRITLRLRETLSVDDELLVYAEDRNRIETMPELAEELVDLVVGGDMEVALTEEYPTWDRLETERRVLN